MSKTPNRIVVRIRDILTLTALAGDPDVRIRVTWRGSNRNSFYHGSCATEHSQQIMNWIHNNNMKVLAIKRDWKRWRAPCAACRGAINVPGSKPEQGSWTGGSW